MSTPQPANPAKRERFALTGTSAVIDPRREAVRRDLADVRLASRVFAPHYAAPMLHQVSTATSLREGRDSDSALMATLEQGAIFEVLEISGGLAWGTAAGIGLVGYVAAEDLEVKA